VAYIRIIDDDVEHAETLASSLTHEGHKVSTSDSATGAVDSLVSDPPDLLILDVMFPDNPAGGFDLARKIRKTPEIKDLPIILLTDVNEEFPMAFSTDDIDRDWMPVQDFIEKPGEIKELLEKVNRLLAEKSD
jgi:DNA-binding response OmpR family regulator